MNRSVYFKTLVCCVIAITLCQHAYTQAKPDEAKGTIPQEVGRENPFERIRPGKKTALLRKRFKRGTSAEYAGELFVQTVMLKFLSAKSLKIALENMLSEYGTIAVDAKSNSLIVSDTEENLEKIIDEIGVADKTPPQIMVEAVILDVQLDDDTEIGVNWDILSDNLYDVSYRQKLGSRLNSTIESTTTIGDVTRFNTTGSVDGGYFAVISGNIRNAVHLLQEKKDVEILASPRVLVVSGESAFIETIKEQPYTEVIDTAGGGVGAMTSTEFKKVGVKLSVTATLTDDNYILVTVEPEQSVDTGKTSSGVPIIDYRKAKTTLLLRDGEVVIMGGLRKKETTNQVNQIPFLGDLPLIGVLFRNTQIDIKNSELIVFLSPHIYRDQEPTEKEMAKFNELRNRPLLEMPEVRKKVRKKDPLP